MSYPNDFPAIDMATIWQSGSYTPNNVVRNIRDNYTPINKNSMRNSVGAEISAVQNYINSKYLARYELPIQTGYIRSIYSYDGEFYTIDTGSVNYSIVRPTGIFSVGTNGSVIYAGSYYANGLNLYSLETFGVFQFNQDQTSLNTSELNITRFHNGENNKQMRTNYSGITFYDSSNIVGIYATPYSSDVSKGFLNTSGYLVINEHAPYSYQYALTVGKANGGGDAFIATHGGMGITLTGDNVDIDRITALGNHFYVGNSAAYSAYTTDDSGNGIVWQAGNSYVQGALQLAGMNYNPELQPGDFVAYSGKFYNDLNVDRKMVIGSGFAYVGQSNQGYHNYGLTVGDTAGSGNVFFQCHDGGGIAFYGAKNGLDNAFDYITSFAKQGFALNSDDGGIISFETPGYSYYEPNYGGIILTPYVGNNSGFVALGGERFGCNSAIPSGKAALVANPSDPATTQAACISILNALKNFGLMRKT